MSPREELLALLRSPGDHEGDHQEAEGLLLDLLGDAEVTAAWSERAKSWWYA